MNEEQRYLFDLNGWVVLKQVVPTEIVQRAVVVLDALMQRSPENLPPHTHFTGRHHAGDCNVANVVEADPVMEYFIDIPEVIDVIAATSGGHYRLNHSYSITRTAKNGFTGFHRGGVPMEQNSVYAVQGGEICSALTKAVFTLTSGRAEHGCFSAIPGSHKSNFSFPWGPHPEDNKAAVAIESEPGDCIIFSEAVRHGSTINASGMRRHSLYYCYSHAWMADWRLDTESFSDDLLQRITLQQRAVIALAGGNGSKPQLIKAPAAGSG